jgi:hypothetical protein
MVTASERDTLYAGPILYYYRDESGAASAPRLALAVGSVIAMAGIVWAVILIRRLSRARAA